MSDNLPPLIIGTSGSLGVGDQVVINNTDPDVLQQMQANYGGWNDGMKECLAEPCKLIQLSDANAVVMSPSGNEYRFNLALLRKYKKPVESVLLTSDKLVLLSGLEGGHTLEELKGLLGQRVELVQKGQDGKCVVKHQSKVYTLHENCFSSTVGASKSSSSTINVSDEESLSRYSVGDIVKVIDDKNRVKALQEGHGGWNKLMKHILNEKGVVKFIGPDGGLIVKINGLQAMLNPKCVVKVDDHNGDSPLHVAVRNKNYGSCCQLIEDGADVNALNEEHLTPIMVAAQIGCEEVLSLLVQHPDARLDIGDKKGNTALHLATKTSNDGAVRILLEKGGNIKATNNQQFTPFHLAAASGHEKILELCLDKHGGSLVDLQKNDKFTALHLATLNNNTACLRLLIKHKADLNIRNIMMQTALHIAVSQKYMDCVKILVESKAELDLQDMNGDTPLHDAICLHNKHKMKEMSPMFGFWGMMMSMEDMFSVMGGSDKPEDIAIYLAEHGASLDTPNMKGSTPLMLCQNQWLRERLRNIQAERCKVQKTPCQVPGHKLQDTERLTNQNVQDKTLCAICGVNRPNDVSTGSSQICKVCAKHLNA